jgi:hypothetical protein
MLSSSLLACSMLACAMRASLLPSTNKMLSSEMLTRQMLHYLRDLALLLQSTQTSFSTRERGNSADKCAS